MISYGSLYPWRFQAAGDDNPIWAMFRSLDVRVTGWVLRDFLLNLALYAPLGACAWLAFRNPAISILLGVLLSAAVEIGQAYVPGRHSSFLDVAANGAGAGIGVLLAITFHHASESLQQHQRMRVRTADPSALVLLVCLLAYVLFPFLPEISASRLQRKITQFTSAPTLEALSSAAAMVGAWYVAGFLLVAAGARRVWLWPIVGAGLIPLQLLLYQRQPTVYDLGGALLGWLLFVGTKPFHCTRYLLAAAMLSLLVMRGTAPFDFSPVVRAFSLQPFAGFLDANWQRISLVLIEKLFFYSAAIWTLRFAGMRLWVAAASVAAWLTLIELAQTRLPGRTAEITDPLLALIIAIGLDAFQTSRKKL